MLRDYFTTHGCCNRMIILLLVMTFCVWSMGTILHARIQTSREFSWKSEKNKLQNFETLHFNDPNQSPVDIITSKAITMDMPVLKCVIPAFEKVEATFCNSGSSVYIRINESASLRPYLVGGPLKEKFVFEEMHFHWGNKDNWGSEHFIDGESFSTEIHIVYYNRKYPSFEDAKGKAGGLAVLAIFGQVQLDNNELLNPLFFRLPSVSNVNSSTTLDSYEAMQWAISAFPLNSEYYSYIGSLTTKPYYGNVTFIVLPRPITLSTKQLSAFRELHSSDTSKRLTKNNERPLQPLHNRSIVRSTKLISCYAYDFL